MQNHGLLLTAASLPGCSQNVTSWGSNEASLGSGTKKQAHFTTMGSQSHLKATGLSVLVWLERNPPARRKDDGQLPASPPRQRLACSFFRNALSAQGHIAQHGEYSHYFVISTNRK